MNNYQFNLDMYKTVAKNVKKYREQKGLTILELANFAEIKESFLKKFETAEENISISIYDLYKISVVLEVEINNFFN